MLKNFIAIIVMATAVFMTPVANALDIEAAIGGWHQSFGGTLGYDEIISSNDVLDMDRDFNFDKKNELFGRIKVELPLFFPNLYALAAPMQFDGTGSKSVVVEYGDLTIPANANLNADITLNQYDLALYWSLPFMETASADLLNVDLGINIRWVDLKAEIHATATGYDERAEADVSAPIPMLFAAAQIKPTDSFSIEAEGRGISIGDNKLYSVIGRVRYDFTGPVFVTGGYRWDKIEIDEDDVLADLEFSGPFIELGVTF